MKFLISSNGPNTSTGYGVQCALLCDRLVRDGHEVAVACNWGHCTNVGLWSTPSGGKVRLYWMGETATSDDILVAHAMHFFGGDPEAGWVIILNDVWAIHPDVATSLAEFNVLAWAPVDHVSTPPQVAGFLRVSRSRVLAMSRHGQRAFVDAGLDPTYVPLAVDTAAYRPTFSLLANGVRHDARTYHGIPAEVFCVGMVAMNKGWVFDRKGFSEALYAFAVFHRSHPNSRLYLHTRERGSDGLNLRAVAQSCGIPDGAIIWSDDYALRAGFTTEMMASLYSSFDVLLAPSHGEGFCVPMLEAQACGTPVIASRATAQEELCGAGWLVDGQPVWDQSQQCPAFMPHIPAIVEALEAAYVAPLVDMQDEAIAFAADYDADVVYDRWWRPLLAELAPAPVIADKDLMTDVAVVVPVMQRPERVAGVVKAFNKANDGTANLYFVVDPDDDAEIAAVKNAGATYLISDRGHTFAQKANVGYQQTTESFLFLMGDDCEPTFGWLAEARKLSDRYDVIGTNDSEPGRIRNQDVARGRHADHWFTRRTYIDDEGASLEGPGIFCPEAYYHWYVDKEVVGLARARGVYGHAHESRVIHHHPGYDGDEAARQADPVYMKAVEWADRDRITYKRREGLIVGHRA